jgi:hypothetical protein
MNAQQRSAARQLAHDKSKCRLKPPGAVLDFPLEAPIRVAVCWRVSRKKPLQASVRFRAVCNIHVSHFVRVTDALTTVFFAQGAMHVDFGHDLRGYLALHLATKMETEISPELIIEQMLTVS